MTDPEPELREPEELDLEAETVRDLELEDGEDVRGGAPIGDGSHNCPTAA